MRREATPPWARNLASLTRGGPAHLQARPAVPPPSAAARAALARPPGVGSKRDGSGSRSRPERPKRRSNSSVVLKIAAPKLRAARLLDQAALGQRLHRRLGGDAADPGHLRAARPAAGRRRSPASRPGPGSAAASAVSASRRRAASSLAGSLASAKPPPTSRRTTPRLPSARSSRSRSIASATWPSVASVASARSRDADRLGREEEQRLDRAGQVAHRRHRRGLTMISIGPNGFACSQVTSPLRYSSSRAKSGDRLGEPVLAAELLVEVEAGAAARGRRAARAAGAPARRSGGCG